MLPLRISARACCPDPISCARARCPSSPGKDRRSREAWHPTTSRGCDGASNNRGASGPLFFSHVARVARCGRTRLTPGSCGSSAATISLKSRSTMTRGIRGGVASQRTPFPRYIRNSKAFVGHSPPWSTAQLRCRANPRVVLQAAVAARRVMWSWISFKCGRDAARAWPRSPGRTKGAAPNVPVGHVRAKRAPASHTAMTKAPSPPAIAPPTMHEGI